MINDGLRHNDYRCTSSNRVWKAIQSNVTTMMGIETIAAAMKHAAPAHDVRSFCSQASILEKDLSDLSKPKLKYILLGYFKKVTFPDPLYNCCDHFHLIRRKASQDQGSRGNSGPSSHKSHTIPLKIL